MAINRNKAFENSDGIILNDTVHISGGTTDPDGSSHVNPLAGDIYVQDDGLRWTFNGTLWVMGLDGFAPEGSNNLFNSAGEVITSNDFTLVAVGSTRGSGGTGEFVVVGKAAPGGTNMVTQLFDVGAMSVLGSITFTETFETRKVTTVTLPITANIVEVQAKKTGGSGTLFSAEVR